MRPIRRLLAPLLVGFAVLGASSTAWADDPASENALRWDEHWARFRPVELVVVGEVGPAAIAEYWLAFPQPLPHWTAKNPFDEGIRSALRLRSPEALHIARTAGSVVDVSLITLAVGLDSAIVPLLRGSVDVGVQLTLMNFESFALNSVVTVTLYDTIGRARPSYDDCRHTPGLDDDCGVSPTASFPSGHVSEAFTTAGLSCAHHTMLPLYGNRLADVLACARDLTLATSDGVLRIMADRHYATDVLAGSGIGFAFGYALPMLLHYTRRSNHAASPAWSLGPLGGGRLGLAIAGTL